MVNSQTVLNEKLGAMPNWDLSDLYHSSEDIELKDDLNQVEKSIQEFVNSYQGKIEALDATELTEAIRKYEQISETLGKIGSFAFLYYTTDMTNQDKAIFFQNIQEQLTNFSTSLLFFTLQLNQLEDSKINELLKDASLAKYQPWIRDLRVFKKYQLSDKEEEILHHTSITSNQAWQRLFDETMVVLRFPFKGQSLTCSEILHKLSEPDAEIRKEAAKSLGKVFGENIKLFTLITNTLAKDKQISDNLRKLPKPISSRNLSNYIEDEVVEALIETVKSNYPKLSHRYYKLKAKWFDREQLDYWDRNAPLPNEIDKIYSWQEAKDIVLSAYNKFSPKLADVAKNFFDNNWIDVPTAPGKRGGAFAHPTVPSSHPYLMLNYLGKARDVMTLAHELGHGVHQWLARKQGALMCNAPLTLAETASVFGEQLTFRYLLDTEAKEENRKTLIASKVEDMLNTVVRQIAFCDFERIIHDERKKGELSTDRINEAWMQVQQESLGSAIKLQDEYKYYWSYIPHFIHSPFYVYSYAFGDCLVNSLYQAYLDEGIDDFENKYFQMLEAGGTKWHKELLKPFGLDASKPEFWQKGLNMISSLIDKLE